MTFWCKNFGRLPWSGGHCCDVRHGRLAGVARISLSPDDTMERLWTP